MISVIIPVFNSETTIKAAVCSVYRQDYSDWELILVDDGSTDGSGKLCDQLARGEDRTRVIHTANHGVSSARNTGMKEALGEFIFFLDSDDTIFPDALSSLVKVQRSENADAVYGGIVYQTRKSAAGYARGRAKPFGRASRGKKSAGDSCVQTFRSRTALKQAYPHLYETFQLHHAAGTLYRADSVGSLTFDPSLSMGEDLSFNLSFLEQASCISVSQRPIYCYRKTSSAQATLQYDPAKTDKAAAVHERAVAGARKLFGTDYEGRAENAVYAGDILRAIQQRADHDAQESLSARTARKEIHRWAASPALTGAVRNMYIDSPVYLIVRFIFRFRLEGLAYDLFRLQAQIRMAAAARKR